MPSSRYSVRVFVAVLDLRAVRKRRVDGAVTVASQIDRLVDALLVVLPVPRGHERDLDLLERAGPVLLLLAFDLDRQRFQRLLELLEQEDGVHARAAGEGAKQHLGRTHRLVVAEHRRLVDGGRMPGSGLDVELDLVTRPARRRFCHTRTIAAVPRILATLRRWEDPLPQV